jgi:hypothetical protein
MLALAMLVGVMWVATPAFAANESGAKSCGTNDHVYTKIRYHDGKTRSEIDTTVSSLKRVTHQTVPENEWVNRYHQPRAGAEALYWLLETWSGAQQGVMSNTNSWPGCED